MKKKIKKNTPPDEGVQLPAYPVNPPGEDIYDKSAEEQNIDPEDVSKTKRPNETNRLADEYETDFEEGKPVKELHKKKKGTKNNEKDFDDDVSGDDLDVPGSELDDEQEANGNEDEENNYYSLGGDDHNDLDEDKGG